MASPEHRAILTDPTYDAIGCGVTTSEGRYFFVCVLAASADSPPPPGSTQPQPLPIPTAPALTTLPDTAVAH